jgi:hypothetical protein
MAITPRRKRAPTEGHYYHLKSLSNEHLEALARLKGSAAEAGMIEYFKAREQEFLNYIKNTDLVATTKNFSTLFKLQDYQSKLLEQAHLQELFKEANEMLMARKKEE